MAAQLPAWLEPQQENPWQPVGGAELGFARLPFEYGALMSEGQIFKQEPGMALKAGELGAERHQNNTGHDGTNFGGLS